MILFSILLFFIMWFGVGVSNCFFCLKFLYIHEKTLGWSQRETLKLVFWTGPIGTIVLIIVFLNVKLLDVNINPFYKEPKN